MYKYRLTLTTTTIISYAHTHQQALFNIDVVIEVVQTVPSQDGNDNTRNYGNRSSQKNPLPLGPLDVEKSLRGTRFKEFYTSIYNYPPLWASPRLSIT